MKKTKALLIISITSAIVASSVTGCYHRRTADVVVAAPTGSIVVAEAPPEPRSEVIGVAPSTAHVWIQGYWVQQSGRWVWVPGHWDLRPSPGATWIPGHWAKTATGWLWTPGHWQ